MCLSCASLAHLLHTSRATVERSSKQVRRKPPVACLLPVAHELHPCLISGAAYFSAVAVPLGSPCLRPSADLLSTEGYFVPRNIRKTRGQRFQFPFLPINFRSAGKLNSCQFPRASTALPKVIGRTKWSWQHEALAQCLKTSARHAPLMIPQNPCARYGDGYCEGAERLSGSCVPLNRTLRRPSSLSSSFYGSEWWVSPGSNRKSGALMAAVLSNSPRARSLSSLPIVEPWPSCALVGIPQLLLACLNVPLLRISCASLAHLSRHC